MDQHVCTVPEGFVPLNYLNDPETEDLIYSDQLAENMVVFIEDVIVRADPDKYATSSPHDKNRTLETSRWCRVTNIRHDGELVTFIGEYSDGSKLKRAYHKSYAWYVKKASMPN